MTNKILYNISFFTIIMAISLMSLFIFWCLYPYKPLVIQEPLKILNENKEIAVGEQLLYRAEFSKSTDILPTISRALVDGVVYTLTPVKPVNNSKGKYDQIISNIKVPQVPAGEYYLKTVTCYDMNPIREICVSYNTEPFKIVEKK